MIASHLLPINVRALVLLNDYYLQLAFADSQDAPEQDDTQDETKETAEVSHEVASTTEESDSSELSEKSSTKESEEEREEVKEKEREEVKEKEQDEIKETGTRETPSREETQNEETSASGWWCWWCIFRDILTYYQVRYQEVKGELKDLLTYEKILREKIIESS